MSMTESEALKILKRDLQIQKDNKALPDGIESLEIAIKSLEEVEQYRAIGTIEEFKALKQWNSDIIESFSKYDVNSVDELMKRFKELTEKAEPKKPIYGEFDENELGEIIPYKATCPTCGFEFEFGTWNDEDNHHCECGQRMNWE